MALKPTNPSLNWAGKDAPAPSFPGRLHAANPGAPTGSIGEKSLLIQGDNLPVLRALLPQFEQKIRCVYLDPPYNTGAKFEHYSDQHEHNAWLTMMRDRLLAIAPLLHPEALIFVQIDDREAAYLQIVMDELFGRNNRLNTICVKMSELSGVKMTHTAHRLPKLKEYILAYGASDQARFQPMTELKEGPTLERYLRYYTRIITNPDDAVEEWNIVSIRDWMKSQGLPTSAENVRATQLQERHRVVYRTNNARLSSMTFPTATAKVISPTGLEYIWWEGKQMLFLKDHCESPVGDVWTDISTINLHREGGVAFKQSKKPEALIERVLKLGSLPGDWVLDAFGGSGTTAAVAERLGRKWVLIEAGDHIDSHIVTRLRHLEDALERPIRYDYLRWSPNH